jgi:hypothetical protein
MCLFHDRRRSWARSEGRRTWDVLRQGNDPAAFRQEAQQEFQKPPATRRSHQRPAQQGFQEAPGESALMAATDPPRVKQCC